uniref:Uncharacterized protein n=1 Tax=Dendroctonus ponderosae TaxID=77166 RepID=A0AAR5PG87_DENPD
MDRVDRRRRRSRNHKAKKPPKVPIKTYRWEDIRRWRRRGGYPWTHLYKGPYSEKVDPQQFTMEAFRKAKSSDRIDASEVSSWADYSGKTTPTLLHELTREPPSKKSSRPGSFILDDDLEDDVQIKEFEPESAETSSENVSQYLDKEEACPKVADVKPKQTSPVPESADRKRKLSTESGHSFMKRIQGAKRKIKVPKISFSTKKLIKKSSSLPKDTIQKKVKKQTDKTLLRKTDDNPQYIYIPLKPPPGETDEFSHLEFQSQGKELMNVGPGQPHTDENSKQIIDGTFGGPNVECDNNLLETNKISTLQNSSENLDSSELNSQLEKSQETNIENTATALEPAPHPEIQCDSSGPTAKIGVQKTTKKSPLKINPAFKQFLKDVRHLKVSEKPEVVDSSTESKGLALDTKPALEIAETPVAAVNLSAECETNQAPILHQDESDVVTDSDDQPAPENTSDGSEIAENDQFDKLFEAGCSKNSDPTNIHELMVPQETSGCSEAVTRTSRSKSAEPEKRRKLSLESRKSLSRLGLMKKIREVSGKVTSALSVENFKQLFRPAESPQKTKTPEKEQKLAKKEVKAKTEDKLKKCRSTPVEPVYIRIPLKPPEGETDEFSYLEGNAPESSMTAEKTVEDRSDSLDTTSPSEVNKKDIQFIFLTPPSDDELLDKDPDIPETPSLDEIVSFGTLKKLAQDVVDQVSPDTKKSDSDTVSGIPSNQSTGKSNTHIEEPEAINDGSQPTSETKLTSIEKMVVDVEDGLNEAAKTDESRKSALKSNEPIFQKRVSFKRKFRVPKETVRENEYEVIEGASAANSIANIDKSDHSDNTEKPVIADCGAIQLESTEVDTNYADQSMAEIAPLEKDLGRSSKIFSDHEYEPISPPPEPTVLPSVLDDDDPKFVISVAEILDRPAEDKKKSFFQFGRFRKDSASSSNNRNVAPEAPSDIPERVPEETKTSKFFKQLNRFRKSPVQDEKIPDASQPEVPQIKSKPKKPMFQKIDFKKLKPKINLHIPQIPDTASIRIPHISLPGARKTTETRTVESRQFSTESNADESEQEPKRYRFDLTFGGTFPRFAKKKKSATDTEVIFATTPRAKKNEKKKITFDKIRIPIHSQSSTGTDETLDLRDENESESGRMEEEKVQEMSTDTENLLNRWKHGSFRERPHEVDTEERIIGELVEQRFGVTGQGFRSENLDNRLRENDENLRYVDNDSDDNKEEEFVLENRRNNQLVTDLDNLEEEQLGGSKDGYWSEGSESLGQKGLLGKLDIDSDEFFVVHEIREGFQTPANALAQMNEYDPIGSNQCLQQMPGKERRKPPMKKPKRKKTPHVSREEIHGDEESIDETILPPRPKRRSAKGRNKAEKAEVVPYQETIPLQGRRLDFPRESLGILGDDEEDNEDFKSRSFEVQENRGSNNRTPDVPARKHKSLRSLNQSETESLLETDGSILEYHANAGPPRRPSRRSDSILADTAFLTETHQNNSNRECIEEPCIQDIRDYMGYAIVDKSKQRDPPLPPPRTLPRRPKRELSSPHKFATLPGTQSQVPPVRPLRNYSTVGNARSSPKYSPFENKENEIDIAQYMEIGSEEGPRDLVSGEIVQKMKRRPLPAPPRPPRKPKPDRRSLYDITSRTNIPEDTVSTQTEPLPPDFACEEISEEPTDKVLFPRRSAATENAPMRTRDQKQNIYENKPISIDRDQSLGEQEDLRKNEQAQQRQMRTSDNSQLQKFHIYDPRSSSTQPVRKELITPTTYTFEETVTHGTLLVQPLDGTRAIIDQQSPRERVVPITKADSVDDPESSEVPDSFGLLKSPEDPEFVVPGAQELQVTDLDVDPGTLNQFSNSGQVDPSNSQVLYSSSSDAPNPQSFSDVEQRSSNYPKSAELKHAEDQYAKTPEHSPNQSQELLFHQERLPLPVPPPRSSTLERTFRDSLLYETNDKDLTGRSGGHPCNPATRLADDGTGNR